MSQTVIGIFDNTNSAQEARAYLLANGFSSENVDISVNGAAAYNNNDTPPSDEGFVDRIANFFSNLFEDEDDATAHTEAAARGTTITVHTRTENETLQAVQILDNFGAVDVDEFSATAQESGDASAGAGLRSRIIERPIEQSLRLRDESLTTGHSPADYGAAGEENGTPNSL